MENDKEKNEEEARFKQKNCYIINVFFSLSSLCDRRPKNTCVILIKKKIEYGHANKNQRRLIDVTARDNFSENNGARGLQYGRQHSRIIE